MRRLSYLLTALLILSLSSGAWAFRTSASGSSSGSASVTTTPYPIGSTPFSATESSQAISATTGAAVGMTTVVHFFWTAAPGTITPPAGFSLACTATQGTNTLNLYTAAGNATGTFTWQNSVATQGGYAVLTGLGAIDTSYGTTGCTSTTAATGNISVTGGTASAASDTVVVAGGAVQAGSPAEGAGGPTGTRIAFWNTGHGVALASYQPNSTTVPAFPWTMGAVASVGIQLAFLQGTLPTLSGTGGISQANYLQFNTLFGSVPTWINALPTCNSANQGARTSVVDNTGACTFLGTPAAGASTFCPVLCNGAAWVED